MIPIEFTCDNELLSGDICGDPDEDIFVFFLHGAGKSDKMRTHYMREKLLKSGISSFGFDFSGHGKSSGTLEKSSLEKRYQEASKAIEIMNTNNHPVTLIGSSMGGHISVRLCDKFEVKNLILFCPGIYNRNAFDVPFSDGFSEILRQKESWRDSDAYDVLETYIGNLRVYIGEEDTVIPDGVIDLIDAYTNNITDKIIYKIQGCGHKIHAWLMEHEEYCDDVVSDISGLIEK